MRVKDLIQLLQDCDPNAVVVSQEYTGGLHAIHKVDVVTAVSKGTKVPSWDGESVTCAVNDDGFANVAVVFIN